MALTPRKRFLPGGAPVVFGNLPIGAVCDKIAPLNR